MIADAHIGGAYVRRLFTRDGVALKGGHELTGDEVRAIPIANRRALVSAGFLDIYPLGAPASAAPAHDVRRFMVHRGGGTYDVIEGRMLNTEVLTKEEADALVSRR